MNFPQTPVTISEDTLLLPSTQTMLADLITFSPNLSLNKETEVVCPPSIITPLQPQSRCNLTTSSHVLNGCVTPPRRGQEANKVHNLMCSLPSPPLHSNKPLHSTQTLSL